MTYCQVCDGNQDNDFNHVDQTLIQYNHNLTVNVVCAYLDI